MAQRIAARTPLVDDDLLGRYADLIVAVGANVQAGQPVEIMTELGNERFLRVVAERAFQAGASFVDPHYIDPYVIASQIALAPFDRLDAYPSWIAERVLGMGRDRAAAIWLSGANERHLLDELEPERVGKWRPPGARETTIVTNDRTWNWTIAGAPSVGWAREVYPDLPEDEALARLWEDVAYMARLDAGDPAAAWRDRSAELERAAASLNALELDSLRFEGPGTDLTIGLLPTSLWGAATETTVDGIEHLVNIPTEEVYTTPDPERTEGVVRATRPLDLLGVLVDGITVRFEGGRAVAIDAARGAEILRGRAASDDGASRLGEVALVDHQSRVGRLGRVFLDTLYDENAASHVALGSAYASAVGDEDRARMNDSSVHIDFMIGGDDVTVTAVTRDGRKLVLLRGGRWQV
jgi:aminopeptidase